MTTLRPKRPSAEPAIRRIQEQKQRQRHTPTAISHLLPYIGKTEETERESQKTTLSIWVLESDPATQKTVINDLQQPGISVQLFENARQMLDKLNDPPEYTRGNKLLLVSLEELQNDLYPFIHAVKQLPAKPNIPILLTALPESTAQVEWALEMGADDFLFKPLSSLVLRTRVKKLQQLHSVKSALYSKSSGIRKDLEAASELQRSLLPKSPLKKPHVTFCWSYQPHGYIAGDMLNVFTLANDLHGFYVADVCGHGAAAAMMSIWLSHTLYPPKQGSQSTLMKTNEAINAMLLHPAYTAAFLESKLADMTHDLYFTMLYAIFDVEQRRMVYSRCGHPYPIVLKQKGECQIVEDKGGPAIGMGLGIPFAESVIQCEKGDRIFVYSDGLLEATAPNGTLFGTERLVQHLCQTRHLPLQEQVRSITQRLFAFQGNKQFDDDVTVIGIELDS